MSAECIAVVAVPINTARDKKVIQKHFAVVHELLFDGAFDVFVFMMPSMSLSSMRPS
jgi:hypothetical protein